MSAFSNDVDLLLWEPVLFRDYAYPSQTLCQGVDGVTSGTSFTSAGASFLSSAVKAGHVIYLYNSVIDSCYEVVEVISDTELTVSVLRPQATNDPIPLPGGSNLQYRISTFDPQAEEIGNELLQYFGINPDGSDDGLTVDSILEPEALGLASVLAILSAVYAAHADGAEDETGLWKKSLHYQKLYHTARSRIRIAIDSDGNQLVNEVRTGGSVRLRRC